MLIVVSRVGVHIENSCISAVEYSKLFSGNVIMAKDERGRIDCVYKMESQGFDVSGFVRVVVTPCKTSRVS